MREEVCWARDQAGEPGPNRGGQDFRSENSSEGHKSARGDKRRLYGFEEQRGGVHSFEFRVFSEQSQRNLDWHKDFSRRFFVSSKKAQNECAIPSAVEPSHSLLVLLPAQEN
jgi:hypothetical protein